ncbi:hypothetical protein E2C01_065693 [Portunus trituberculatus]|uniref:Uncharacterized protein n=1 Tax=Portunus trituberculatus TaxID=210409 RepID=A0A5B7HN88_PORTR|nr:hypothetical protein [Portunus trituberculatus]
MRRRARFPTGLDMKFISSWWRDNEGSWRARVISTYRCRASLRDPSAAPITAKDLGAPGVMIGRVRKRGDKGLKTPATPPSPCSLVAS